MSGTPHRSGSRAKLFQPGTMTVLAQEQRVHLLDIGSEGARLHVEMPPIAGDTVRIMCGVPLGPAQVIGVTGRYVEVAFRIPLSAMTVDRLVQAHGVLRSRIAEVPPLAR